MTKTTPCGSRSIRRSKLALSSTTSGASASAAIVGDIVGTLVEALELAAVAHRPAHLPGEFRHHLIDHLVEPRDALQHQLNALFQRPLRPGFLRLARARDHLRGRLQRHRRALGVNRAVDG